MDRVPDFLQGGAEMAKAIFVKDWSQTPLGPIDGWPQSLRTTVSLCLASSFPISIAWGPSRTQIYNDGYWPICGAKHPHSMGQDFKECWFSAWPVIGESFERAQRGETSFLENQRIFLDRNGFLEETFFTFSFSPIRDESGSVGGLFHPVTETTPNMLAERRTRALRDLAARGAKAASVEEACAGIMEVLAGCAFDVPFALLFLPEEATDQYKIANSIGLPAGIAADWPLPVNFAAGEPLLMNIGSRLGTLACGPYPEPPLQALVLPVPGMGSQRAAALLVAGVSSRLPLDEGYRGFFDLLAGHIGTILAAARGYQEERRKAEALAELDRAKTLFFSNVSHEFRTPLTLMLAPLEDLLANAGNAPWKNELTLVHRNGLRLLKLVNTLLDFSRIEAGRVQAVFQPTDLSRLTADLASAFRSAVERAGLEFVVDCPPLDQPLDVDHEMWEKIVLNLISNAFKFTFQGSIRVSLMPAEGQVELAVEDTGTGIAANELPRVFERFHRIQGAPARTHEGAGIGLALVQELVRLHGGVISVTSEWGSGSRFSVKIPSGARPIADQPDPAKPALSSTATGARPFVEEALHWLPGEPIVTETAAPVAAPEGTILLADDNADMRDYLQRVLAAQFEVHAVPDGLAALDLACRFPVDLVLTDVMMPRMDGFELLRRLRSETATKTIPVILLSARAGEESRVEGLNAGADDYLVKPFTSSELLARVAAHLRLAKTRKEAAERLRIANKELESFAYSVSHDLRGPLRGIDGWSLALLEDYGAQLAPRAHQYLQRVRSEAQRMGLLIDDLLELSRITCADMRTAAVDLSALANAVADRLCDGAPDRKIDFVIERGLTAVGDAPLLDVALANLFGNAVKFTGRLESARIEFGQSGNGGEKLFYVKDNGIGFDMAHAKMLFGAFQRFHKDTDFPGTGIGLATVQRVIHRHGGRVWAEAEPEHGATFYFTLPG